MFNINNLQLVGTNNEKHEYLFKKGINYYKGKNSSGKTVFYNFLDYMFGSSDNLSKNPCFESTLHYAILEFEYNSICYEIKRNLNPNDCYFKYKNEEWGEPIDLNEYRECLNVVFTVNEEYLKELREFTEEDLTYRTFTLFNFLGERGQGNLNNFFDKTKEIKYSVKLNSILNYIFNNNLESISQLRKKLSELQLEIKRLEKSQNKFEFVKNGINLNLKKLNIAISYNGKNKDEILAQINNIKNMEQSKTKKTKNKTIADLQSIFYNLDEQIKIYENRINDSKKIELENINRMKILDTFSKLLIEKPHFEYLIDPVTTMINDLDKNIAFSTYIIKNNTINELKNQRIKVKDEIQYNEIKYTIFDIDEKIYSITLIEEYLTIEMDYDIDKLDEKRKKVRELKNEIKILQNTDDDKKIEDLSQFITNLYKSGGNVSEIVKIDNNLEDFFISYIKHGNTLQPTIAIKNEDISLNASKKIRSNYSVGSMARQTLIQLCGYLGFLNLIINENRFPLIPILIVDHISKPFDLVNRAAIGQVFQSFYKKMNK
jgi:uncharacterized protein YdcH (DUF465 family)